MNKYIQFQFFKTPIDGNGWSGWQARQWVSKQLDSKAGTDALFHYKDGKPASDYPMVRFLGGKNSFRIIGIGEQGIKAVMDNAVYYHTLDEMPMRVEMTSGPIDIIPSDGNIYTSYFIPSQKLSAALRVGKAFKTDDHKSLKKWLKERVQASITRQIEALNLPAFNFEVNIASVEPHTPVPIDISNNKQKLVPMLKISFFIDQELKGPWSIGALTSRGHGNIKRMHPMLNQKAISA